MTEERYEHEDSHIVKSLMDDFIQEIEDEVEIVLEEWNGILKYEVKRKEETDSSYKSQLEDAREFANGARITEDYAVNCVELGYGALSGAMLETEEHDIDAKEHAYEKVKQELNIEDVRSEIEDEERAETREEYFRHGFENSGDVFNQLEIDKENRLDGNSPIYLNRSPQKATDG